ncbi:MAG TPA: class III poly(R)-hydroxyalkanoic acid synthase subunit PhaC [Clostridia bacterium]|nr:class III poly(R)-hydroxyalkanoic acid synthase subunit PhaC [Clostridia bacterium]
MNPTNPSAFIMPWVQWQQAFIDESFATVGRLSHLPTLWQRARQVRKGVSPAEVVYEEDRVKVRHYLSAQAPRYRTPVVFIYALVNRPYILDLKEGRSVVANFVRAGFDTYLVDWGIPTAADRHLTLEDYINGYMVNVLDYLRERTGVDQANIVGYCMGGTMSAMFTSLHPKRVNTLTLMAAPIDFAPQESLLNVWSQAEHFDVDKFVDAFGNCPAEFLQACFLMMRPVGNFIEKPLNFYEHLHQEKFLEDFLTTETWLQDNIPVPGEVYRQFVKYLYQKNLLVQNRMPVGKHIVNLQQITCPVLNIMASRDDLVPCSQGQPFNDLVGSRDRRTLLLEGGGHIGLAIGGKAQKEIWPQACQWVADRSEAV